MTRDDADTEELVERARAGEDAACQELLVRFRPRLKQMLAVRLDRRLASRLDPSDVVQEVLVDAHRKLAQYLRDRPMPFYPWLRQLAWERLVKLHRRHLHAKKRSVRREAVLDLPDESAWELAQRLQASATSPSQQAVRRELRERVHAALARLNDIDREVLVLRYLEQLTTAEIAAVLGIREGAVRARHVRALERLQHLLGPQLEGDES